MFRMPETASLGMTAAGQGGSGRTEPDAEHRKHSWGPTVGPEQGQWMENTWEGPSGWGGLVEPTRWDSWLGQTKGIKAGDEQPSDGNGEQTAGGAPLNQLGRILAGRHCAGQGRGPGGERAPGTCPKFGPGQILCHEEAQTEVRCAATVSQETVADEPADPELPRGPQLADRCSPAGRITVCRAGAQPPGRRLPVALPHL